MSKKIELISNGFSGDIVDESKTLDVTLIPDFRKVDEEGATNVACVDGMSVPPFRIGEAIEAFANESCDEIVFHEGTMLGVMRTQDDEYANVGYVDSILRNAYHAIKKDGTPGKYKTGFVSLSTSVGNWLSRKSYCLFKMAKLYHLVDVIEEERDPGDACLPAELLVFYESDALYYRFDEPVSFSYSYYDYSSAESMDEFRECRGNVAENTADIIAIYRTPFGVLLEDASSNEGGDFYILITDEKIEELFYS